MNETIEEIPPEEKREREEDPIDYRNMLVRMREIGVGLKQLCELPPGELAMLIILAGKMEPDRQVRPSELGKEMHLSRPAVSRMLRSLKEKGYLKMSVLPEDHRYVKIVLTEEGIESLDREMSRCADVFKRVVSRMGDEAVSRMMYYNSMFTSILMEEIR